jgi:hypothetical protein
MKLPSVVFVSFVVVLKLQAEDPTALAIATQPAIVGPVANGSPSPPVADRPIPALSILKTVIKRVVREEPAPLPDMQPVRKRVTITKHLVEEPVLPQPTALEPASASVAEEVGDSGDSVEQRSDDVTGSELVFLSATVYDHSRTLLRWSPPGKPGDEMTAWSNVDFNLLDGFNTFKANGICYSLILCLNNQNSDVTTDEIEPAPPDLPALLTAGPAYIVTEGDANDKKASAVITGLHDLYQAEAPRLQAAYAGREKARIEREAYLRAHPPQPRNVTTWITKARKVERPADNIESTGKEVQP